MFRPHTSALGSRGEGKDVGGVGGGNALMVAKRVHIVFLFSTKCIFYITQVVKTKIIS